MEALYDIPVIGLVIQFVAYVVGQFPLVAPIIVAAAVPIVLGALCGFMNERSGVVNIGIEGMMLIAAFAAWWAASLAAQAIPASPGPFGITPALFIGLLAGILAACLTSVLHAWLSISLRADQIISGTIINLFAFGITGYLNLLVSQHAPRAGGQLSRLLLPGSITEIPVIGLIVKAFVSVGPIALSMLVSVVVLQYLLYRSRWGLRTRAVGEHPRAAETVGIDVIRLRYRNVILGGIFAGLAGSYLTIEFGNAFQSEMTNGRGFIALAALIFGRWTPLGSFGAALLFMASVGLERSINISPPTGTLGELMTAVPSQFYGALPYIITIVVLAGFVGRSVAPAADGIPYQRESKAA
jgi:general nucleoside transport system permease protein